MEKRVLIARWLGSEAQAIPIYDEASVSSARQRVREAGQRAGLNRQLVESVTLIASELTHNQLAHAKQGYFSIRAIERGGVKGLEAVAADMGPGIEKPNLAVQDNITTAGTLGAGLGAVCRIADEVEFDNRLAEGLCVVARKFETRAPALCCEAAIMGRPYPGEGISGDDGVFLQSESSFLGAVADGLGHGPEARQASNCAIQVLELKDVIDLNQTLVAVNQTVTGTRGCVLAMVGFDKRTETMDCISAGDVHCHLYHLKDAHFFTPSPLVLGTGQWEKHRIRIERVPVHPGSVLVIFSDGLKSRANLKGQLDILRQPAIAIAQHLLENESRPDDDALVLVARFKR